MRLKAYIARGTLLLAAVFFAVGLQAYLRIQALWGKVSVGSKLTHTDSCEAPVATPAAPAENPNKLLFISCGGFEE